MTKRIKCLIWHFAAVYCSSSVEGLISISVAILSSVMSFSSTSISPKSFRIWSTSGVRLLSMSVATLWSHVFSMSCRSLYRDVYDYCQLPSVNYAPKCSQYRCCRGHIIRLSIHLHRFVDVIWRRKYHEVPLWRRCCRICLGPLVDRCLGLLVTKCL